MILVDEASTVILLFILPILLRRGLPASKQGEGSADVLHEKPHENEPAQLDAEPSQYLSLDAIRNNLPTKFDGLILSSQNIGMSWRPSTYDSEYSSYTPSAYSSAIPSDASFITPSTLVQSSLTEDDVD